MVTKIIWLSFLLGVSSTIATLLYLLLSLEGKPRKTKFKPTATPKNEIPYTELLKAHKQSEQTAGSA
jgi:hypothetical protein